MSLSGKFSLEILISLFVFVSPPSHLSPTYVTPKNFDFVKPPKEREIITLDASRLEFMKNQMTENQYESCHYEKLPIPPPAPNVNEKDADGMEEENNFSDNNNKEMDKQIDLPLSLDTPNKDDDQNSTYAEFQFDEDKDD